MFWNRHPAEHAGLRWRHGPTDPLQTFAKRITPALIDCRLAFHAGIALSQRHDRCDLHSLEHSVVVVTLDRGKRLDHLPIAGAEANATTGHVVAFAHRREFNADFGRTGRCQETWRLVTIECDICVREVANYGEAISASELHDF